jgi:hypothetical protein
MLGTKCLNSPREAKSRTKLRARSRDPIPHYSVPALGVGGGLREDDPSDDGDDEEDREELDRRGRHARPPRPPDPRQAARIRGDARAGMELREPGRRDREP